MALDKTEWATEEAEITFLGVRLNGHLKVITLPDDKQIKALKMIQKLIDKGSATVKELEKLTGFLNFLNRAMVPGRPFTRRMYAKFTGAKLIGLHNYHHVRLDGEFKSDCKMCINFLHFTKLVLGISRPFTDFEDIDDSTVTLQLLSDATANSVLGFSRIFESSWYSQQWEPRFIDRFKPSIEFLELYAVCMGVFMWSDKLAHTRFILFCDNQSVCNMIKASSSNCQYCMMLLRLLTLRSLKFNFRVFAHHISGEDNYLSHSLSRMKIELFHKQARKDGIIVKPNPTPLNTELWPLSKYWENHCKNLN